jgi:proline dehydrogenase
MRQALLWMSRNQWLGKNLPRYRFARAAVQRFMPGEDVAAALGASGEFERAGLSAVITRLGENVTSLDVARQVADHYRVVLDRIAERGLASHISIKLTHLGLDLGAEHAGRHLATITAHAQGLGNIVWVDMEGSVYTERTIDLFRDVLTRHRNLGLCLQAYLHRAERDLDTLLEETRAIRLVKGAYNEPPAIAYTRKRDVDDAFHRLALRLLAEGPSPPGEPAPALASHDVPLLERIATESGAAPSSYEIQMLYGIRTADQGALAAQGHAVRILISYGPEWFAWFIRRLAERPANLAFVARNLIPV